MNRTVLVRAAVLLVIVFTALSPMRAMADDIFNVTIDTSGLGSLSDSEIFFILTGVGGNTASLNNFTLGGGTAGAVDTSVTTGGARGNLASGILLNDTTNFLNVLAQSFVSGSDLSFLVDLTTNVVSPAPDQFSIEVADSAGNLVPSSDPSGFDNLLSVNLDSASPKTNIYSGVVSTAAPTPVPEPSILLMLGCGLLTLPMLSRRSIKIPSAFPGTEGSEAPPDA